MSERANRCYQCGRRVADDAGTCEACGAVLHILCECGATASAYALACPACNDELEPLVYRPRRTAFKIVGVLLLLAAVGALAVFLFPRNENARLAADYEKAYFDFKAGSFESARVRFASYLARHGESAPVRYMLGLTCRRLGRQAEAVAHVRRALDRDPHLVPAALFLGEASLSEAEPAEALRMAELVLGFSPKSGPAHSLAGRVLARPGLLDVARASWHLQQAIRLRIDDPEVYVLLAELTMVRGRVEPGFSGRREAHDCLEAAKERIRELIRAGPDRPEHYFFLARCEYAALNLEDASVYLAKSLSRGPETPEQILLSGKLQWKQRNEAGAERAFERLQRAEPDVAVLLDLAEFFREEGRPDRGEEILADASDRSPRDPRPVLILAQWRIEAGRADVAEALLTAAAGDHPEQPLISIWLADAILAQPGRRAEAEALLRDAAEFERPGVTAALRLADLLLETPASNPVRARRIEEAAGIIDAAGAGFGEDDPLAIYRDYLRGKLCLVTKRFAEAVEFLSRVTRRNPEDPLPHLLLATAHEIRREPGLAELELSTVLRIAGPDPDLLMRRARARLLVGGTRWIEARQDARAAFDLAPDREDVLLLLALTQLAGPRPEQEEAELWLKRAAARPGATVRPRIQQGRLALLREDLAAAQGFFAAALAAARGAGDRYDCVAGLAEVDDRRVGTSLSEPARARFAEYLESWPEDLDARVRHARRLLDAGDLAEARRLALEVLGREPGRLDAIRIHFETHLGEDPDRETLRAILAPAVEAAPGRADVLYMRGKLALFEGRGEEAARLLSEAWDRNPRDARAAYYLATAHLRAGSIEEAREAIARSVALEPRHLPARRLLAELLFRRSRTLIEDGSSGAALGELIAAVRADPGHLPALAQLMTSWFGPGGGDPVVLDFVKHRCEVLVRREVASRRPDELQGAWLLLAGACRAAGDRAGLVRACEGYVALRPDEAAARYRLGLALIAADRAEEALAVLEASRDLDPASLQILALLADVHRLLGRPDRAASLLREWVEAHPHDAGGWVLLGRLTLSTGDPVGAAEAFEEAVRLDADRLEGAVGLLLVHLQAGDATAAVEAMSPLLERTGRTAEVRFLVGCARLAEDPASPEGIRLLQRAFRGEIRDAAMRSWCASTLLEALFIAERIEEGEEIAREFATWARALRPFAPDQVEAGLLAEAYLRAATLHHRAGHFALAVNRYRRVLQLRPGHHLAANNLAALLVESGGGREAVGLARQAVNAMPEVPAYHGTLALALAQLGRHQESLESAGRAATYLQRRIEGAEGDAARELSRQLGSLELRRARSLLALDDVPATRQALRAATAADAGVAGSEEHRRIESELDR